MKKCKHHVKANIGVEGRYRLEAFKLDENGNKVEVRKLTGWFKNLILNNGLNLMGSTGNYLSYCQIGTGTTAADVTQNSLVNRLNATTSDSNISSNYNPTSTPPYYGRLVRGYRFTPGQATGNLAEVGIGPSSTGNLFSRARIVDTNGNPTTITVLADEYLDVYYDIRYYISYQDNVFQFLINGVTYTGTIRPFQINSTSQGFSYWSYIIGTQVQVLTNYNNSGFTNWVYKYPRTLGAVTADAAGTSIGTSSYTNDPYVSGTYTKTATITVPLTSGNDAAGVGGFDFAMYGCWAVSITPAIMKTSLMVLTFKISISWSRYAP